MTWNRRRTVLALAALAALALVARMMRPKAVIVETEAAVRGPLTVSVEEEGHTEVRDRYVVGAPVIGRVERVDLKAGDSVRRNAVVACISPQILDRRAYLLAQSRIDEAMDEARAADAAVAQAQAALDQARRDRERSDRLVAQHAISAQDSERAALAEITRRREYEAAVSRRDVAGHQVDEARTALEAAAPGGARQCLDIRAPVAGRVLRVLQESERVVIAGAPILEVGDPSRLDVVAELLSEDAVRVHPGDTMLVRNWGGEGDLVARVRRIEPSGFTKVSALGVEEQRVRVIAEVPSPPRGLGDEYRVDVRIVLWRGDSVLQVPSTALFRRNGAWWVFVLEGGRTVSREVRVGREGGGRTEVTEGLEAGAQVVRHPSDRIKDGARAEAARAG